MASEDGKLVLTRLEGQEIKIGRDVTVRVVRIKGEKVRLAVIAPLNVAVHRREVWDRVMQAGQEQPPGRAETGPAG